MLAEAIFMSQIEPTSDAKLVEQILNGDQTVFAQLVTMFHRRVYSIAYRMVGNVTEAEDLCQEIFLRVYQNLARYDPNLPLALWICRVASNTTINFLKRRSLKTLPLQITVGDEEVDRPIADGQATPEQAMINRKRNKELQKAILGLPENY